MSQGKTQEIKLRVTPTVKREVVSLALQRGEAESVIVREALAEYLARKLATPYPAHPATADLLADEAGPADTAAALKSEAVTALRALAHRKRGNGHPPAHTPPPTAPMPPPLARP